MTRSASIARQALDAGIKAKVCHFCGRNPLITLLGVRPWVRWHVGRTGLPLHAALKLVP